MINTVIFDMDGTVLDTLDDLTDSMNYVLKRFKMPCHGKEDYRRFFGNGVRYALEKAVVKGTPSETIDCMLPIFKKHYNKHCLDHTKPYDGISELMKELKTEGYKLAIVSNKIDSAVKELNRRFFSEVIEVAIGESPGIRRKPAPDTVLEAMKALNSNAAESMYVGDSEVDFETARNAGLPCISVLWGFRSEEFLRENGASVFARQPGEVLRILHDASTTHPLK